MRTAGGYCKNPIFFKKTPALKEQLLEVTHYLDSNVQTKQNHTHKVEGLTYDDPSVPVNSVMGGNLAISTGTKRKGDVVAGYTALVSHAGPTAGW